MIWRGPFIMVGSNHLSLNVAPLSPGISRSNCLGRPENSSSFSSTLRRASHATARATWSWGRTPPTKGRDRGGRLIFRRELRRASHSSAWQLGFGFVWALLVWAWFVGFNKSLIHTLLFTPLFLHFLHN